MLKVAFYRDYAPFSDDGKGVDVELARLLSAKLGVRMEPLWFDADENMEDDLRNMVWKGHYLGYGPADVMMHAPVDAEFMARVPQVKFFAPYYRERFAIARNAARIPRLESMEPFARQTIGVEGGSYSDTVLLSADAGAYRANVVHFKSTAEAVAALRAGEVAAVMGQRGELEGGVAGVQGLEVGDPPLPLLQRRQWAVGLAVKSANEELARALQQAMNELAADGSLERLFNNAGVQYRAP